MPTQAAPRFFVSRYPVLFSAIALALLFWLFPSIDIRVSALAFSQGHFMDAAAHWWIGLFYYGIPVFAWVVLLGLAGGLLLKWSQPDWRKPLLFLLCALLLGPGVLVHGIFKDHWGRARPFQVEQFGGPKQFTAAWVKADQCDTNCSFVSGHVAMAFFPMMVAMLGRRYRVWLYAGALTGVFTGLARISQGGHFLSDVVFAFYVVYFAAWLSYWLVFRHPPRLWGKCV